MEGRGARLGRWGDRRGSLPDGFYAFPRQALGASRVAGRPNWLRRFRERRFALAEPARWLGKSRCGVKGRARTGADRQRGIFAAVAHTAAGLLSSNLPAW